MKHDMREKKVPFYKEESGTLRNGKCHFNSKKIICIANMIIDSAISNGSGTSVGC